MMNQSGVAVLALGLIVYVCILVPSAAQQPGGAHSEGEMEWAIGGVGGAYFLAEPGELVVEVVKRDRNIRGARTDLRAILVGPDREVLQEAVIPHDGGEKGSGLGPPQRARLVAQVERKGVYALNITVSPARAFWLATGSEQAAVPESGATLLQADHSDWPSDDTQ